MSGEPRVPCPRCGASILQGALKCRSCRKWVAEPNVKPPRMLRSLALILAAAASVGIVLVSSQQSRVAEAPPLTVLTASASASQFPAANAAHAPSPTVTALQPEQRPWRSRQLSVDTNPLDLVFSPSGKTIYVSANDASLREYDVATGRLLHMAKVPAQGDRIRLLNDRYVAIIRPIDAAHIPVLDTQNWDRDAILLAVGRDPADVIALPDGATVVTASRTGKRLSWFNLANGRRLADIKLPHEPRRLYLMNAQDRTYVAAMGVLYRGKRQAGAWLDLFDPNEAPFGATRRSISVGRDPGEGVVTEDQSSLLFVDHVSNVASLLRVDTISEAQSVAVGLGPRAAFLMNGDRHGVTIDGDARTATVVALDGMERVNTLMLNGDPRSGATSPDGSTLFLSLGGDTWPPRGSGAVVISGDPPRVMAQFETGKGAARVVVSSDGTRAAISNYRDKAITIIER